MEHQCRHQAELADLIGMNATGAGERDGSAEPLEWGVALDARADALDQLEFFSFALNQSRVELGREKHIGSTPSR